MKNNDLFSIYGARRSKDGKRINIALVRGKDDSREWATISLEIDGEKSKTKCTTKDEFAYVKIPIIKPIEKKADVDIF